MEGNFFSSRTAQRDSAAGHIGDLGDLTGRKLLGLLDEPNLQPRLVMSDEALLRIGPPERIKDLPRLILFRNRASFL